MVRQFTFAIALLLSHPCAAADIMGQATVIDGDTIEIRGKWIMLFDIDAPESTQTCTDANSAKYACGQRAAFELANYIGRQTIRCENRGRDRCDNMIAICYAGNQDIAAWLLEEGWAFSYRRFPNRYLGLERIAEIAERGMWRGEFVMPWDWRKGMR